MGSSAGASMSKHTCNSFLYTRCLFAMYEPRRGVGAVFAVELFS